MKPHLTGLLCLTTAVVLLCADRSNVVVAAEPEAKAPAGAEQNVEQTPEEAAKIASLLAKYRATRKDEKQREEVVREAVAIGPAAAAAFLTAINRELAAPLKRYSTKFTQQACLSAKKHFKEVDIAEVVITRQKVQALAKVPRFSKETIVALGDPKIKRLEEIFVVDREVVLSDSKALRGEREKLLPLGKLWETCAVKLYEQTADGPDKPQLPPTFEGYLRGTESLACQQAMPMDNATRAILAANERTAAQLDPEEARAILALNLMRILVGLPALTIDLKLCTAAREHSKDMREQKFFDHTSPVPGKNMPADRAKRVGTSCTAENIAMGVYDGKIANEVWFHSPGHHQNLLAPHRRVGVGRDGVWFTEMFGD
jgi:uncharacterized protein YkwD